ncbi:YdcF family protein [Chitinophaga japonensis]|uniref:DUF218 domain-containing protein n=1 Tax=Chitinophaga japonensis TaxID=104662 RepID=A0A562T736_CHIJA|nr:YdcF family protein [Chitinophaga japonensis]TWI89078.1 DUF218 domain-containing protein [Chitinophaga japonensis]
MIHRLYLCCLLGLLPVLLRAQNQPSFDPAYQFVQSGNYVQDKNFYLLTLFEQEPALQQALAQNSTLKKYYRQFRQQVLAIPSHCASAACYASALLLDEKMVDAVAGTLEKLYSSQPAFRAALQPHLKPSGAFMRHASLPEAEMLAQRWKEEAEGLNYILNAYTQNTGFRYPRIDSAAYYVKSPAYAARVKALLTGQEAAEADGLFFAPTLHFAMDLLALNKKDHAGRHEPLAATNAAAYKQAPRIPWERFPYSAILVLGAGPADDQPISPACKARCRTGAVIFRENKAPFIIVSGGYVHPFGTPYSEAIEMKKFLADSCGIPAGAIIVEPHARHTTTNVRNANRILYRNGFPMDKKVLCTSSPSHLVYLTSIFYEQVCRRDLGYIPLKEPRKLNDNQVEYLPVPESLHEDPRDPLDP